MDFGFCQNKLICQMFSIGCKYTIIIMENQYPFYVHNKGLFNNCHLISSVGKSTEPAYDNS